MNLLRKLAVAIFALGSVSIAQADPITYVVNIAFDEFTVQGSITTDGTLGDIPESGIVDFSLALFDGIEGFTLNSGNSSADGQWEHAPGLLTATATELLFDFSAPISGFIKFDGPLPSDEWQFFLQNGSGSDVLGITHAEAPGREVRRIKVNLEDDLFVLGTVSVPEPGTLALLGLGLVGMAARRRKKV